MSVAAAARAWRVLESVPDPEIPVVSVVDLGIVRAVEETPDGRGVTVTMTPTYSGCPATEVIARDVRTALASTYDDVRVVTRLSPAWTTDWMSETGRDKLRGFGIAPPSRGPVVIAGPEIPRRGGGHRPADDVGPVEDRPESCPRCGSTDTEELAGFGSTPCKALWRCTSCREPFDHFKRH